MVCSQLNCVRWGLVSNMVEINHKERDHALLSASAAKRWLTCTPSARLSEQFPDTAGDAAKEGTLAHEIAELKLRKHFLEPMGKATFTRRLNKLKKQEFFQTEMLNYTDSYADHIKEIALSLDTEPYVAVEKQLDYSSYAPEGFGTVDCLMIGSGTLYIIDFKYGKHNFVSAENNAQMRYYALGALQEYGWLYPIQQVSMTIFQPRVLDGVTEETLSVEDLIAWGEANKPRALLAFEGKGELVLGDHCVFCRAKPICKAQAEQFNAVNDFGLADSKTLSKEEISFILDKKSEVESWLKSLKDYAIGLLMRGEKIPGQKLVEGRKSRSYSNLDEAFKFLQDNGVDEALLYERSPLTVPKLEKVLGKKDYEELLEKKGFVQQLPGKPTLVPESDKRPEIIVTPDASEDFK